MDGLPHVAENLCALADRFIGRGDLAGLETVLRARWSPECLVPLLNDFQVDVVRTAATSLGLIGEMPHCEPLAALLHHEERAIIDTVENALWSIWFRQGGPDGLRSLRMAANLVERRLPERALNILDALIVRDSRFAEAHHQRSIARCLCDQYPAALGDARRAVRLNPVHFAAWAGQGNCLTHLGRYAEAHECYGEALRIHPRLDIVRESMRELAPLLGTASAR